MTQQLKLRTNKDFRLHYLLVAHHKQSEPYGDIQLFTANKKEMLEVRALKKSIKVSISFQKKKRSFSRAININKNLPLFYTPSNVQLANTKRDK